ncbi:hypothetical protein FQN50_003410 [Emmonsiellopsis sp. PD_5]|nr:hypothetical protein FQN50_003410 [Emmonsiellopsis sp. PD_5]
MAYDEESKRKARGAIEAFCEVYKKIMDEKDFKGYDKQLMQDLRLIEANPAGGATWELPVTEFWANLNGITIRIRATVIQHGRTMALIGAVMESPDGKVVYATAEHHKVHVPALPEYAARMKEGREGKAGAKL